MEQTNQPCVSVKVLKILFFKHFEQEKCYYINKAHLKTGKKEGKNFTPLSIDLDFVLFCCSVFDGRNKGQI